jgi:3,4-dihydroxy 2-butanone 4-phosphate synthase/GTP cyclohydrolase II
MAQRRPFVTIAFAQSIDGSLAAEPGKPLPLSGPASSAYTHRLRASHDAILVGIGTVLADNPRLTVRLAEGANPQPIVVDSRLRFPDGAALLAHPTRHVWIATTAGAPMDRFHTLRASGAEVLPFPADHAGRVSLPHLLDDLGARGIQRLMVEGGAAIITAFLGQGLADRLSVTIAPRLVGGVRALQSALDAPLRNPVWRMSGPDVILEARLSEREDP